MGSIFVIFLAVLEQFELPKAEDILLGTKSVVLAKSKPKIFQLVSDLRIYPQWHSSLRSCEPTDTSPVNIGKHYVAIYDIFLLGESAYDVIISSYESPNKIGFLIDNWSELRTEISVEK